MESAQAEGSFTQPKLSKKQEWYQKHKDDPVYMERMRESRRKYYEKNKKDQSDKALDRYYAKLSEKLLNA
jgi:hypothetical protein